MQSSFILLFNCKQFPIPSDFESLNCIKEEIKDQLLKTRQYEVQSDVQEYVFRSFIKHLLYNEIPNITNYNISEFEELSNEFDWMKNLVQTFQKNILRSERYSLLIKNKIQLEEKKDYFANFQDEYSYINGLLLRSDEFIALSASSLDLYDLSRIYKDENTLFIEVYLQEKTCIDHLTYSLNERDNTAIITGFDDMVNDVYVPKTIHHKSKEYLVTQIYDYSFKGKNNLNTLKFADDSKVHSLGSFTFTESSIKSITIPPEVLKIDSDCFSESELQSITFSNKSKLQIIEEGSFERTSIKSITIPERVTEIESLAFRNSSLENIYFSNPLMIKRIGLHAFNSTLITEITIPSNIEKINEYTFSNCRNLVSVKFTENSKLKTIKSFAFTESTIQCLTIPSSVIKFEDDWCDNTSNLNTIEVLQCRERRVMLYKNEFLIQKSNLKNKQYNVLLFARRDIGVAIIPSFIEKINSSTFDNCKKLSAILFSRDSKLKIIGDKAFACSSLKNIKIPQNVSEIGKRAFYECSKFKKIEFECNSQLRTIGESAFEYTSLENITTPPGVVDIRSRTFAHCPNLSNVCFPKLLEMDWYVFEGSSVNCLKIPSDINQIFTNWCENAININEIQIIPRSDENIKCYDNKYLITRSDIYSDKFDTISFVRPDIEVAEIPSFITKIGNFAFSSCPKLKKVIFAENSKLEKIGIFAFSRSNIKSISLPPKLIEIGEYAFEYSHLEHVEFQKNSQLKIIRNCSFAFSKLKCIEIPKNVIQIQENAFWRCKSLTIVDFHEKAKLKEIGKGAFAYSAIRSFQIPRNVQRIGSYAFGHCSELQIIEKDEKSELKFVEDDAFEDTKLEMFMKHVFK